jgi:hypothetical protein
MLEWLAKRFLSAKEPRYVDVGRASVSVIETDGTKHELELIGEYAGKHPMCRSQDWIFDAEYHFRIWQDRSGETGMCSLGGGRYVPLCNIKSITVEYSSKEIPV